LEIEVVTEMESRSPAGYSTVYHLPFDSDVRARLTVGGETPSESTFESVYVPAESLIGVTDPKQAYRLAQGFIVNETQNARHMVRSASPGDIIKTVEHDGDQTYYFVDRIGFDELDFGDSIEPPVGSKDA
jgi:hypothetical protein